MDSYPLRPLASRNNPTTLPQLEAWLHASTKGRDWDGKLYVASTIKWDGQEFSQCGCSPNYFAGWWTLACCKHDMRRSAPFQAKVKDYTIPTYIFTFARQDCAGQQALVSVAEIEKDFPTMQDYARFLVRSRNRKFRLSRLTRLAMKRGLGWRFGDCHSDETGKVGKPNAEHVHAEPGQWRRDIDSTHLILVSKRFILWDRPVFVSLKILKQSRFGYDVRAGNFGNILVKAGKK